MRRVSIAKILVLLLAGSLATGCGSSETPAAAAVGDAATADDAAYLTQLGLIRGHLRVGMELYREGRYDHAKRHMKHPEDELYASLVDDFERRGTRGFGEALARLASLVEQDADAAAVEGAYSALLVRIAAAEAAAPPDVALHGRVAASLLATAAEEYGIGVVDGRIREVHEYQDAYGFTQIASEHAARAGGLEAGIEALAPLWPELVPEGGVDGDAARIGAARARVEQALRQASAPER